MPDLHPEVLALIDAGEVVSLHPEVQHEIDRISKWYADHYKIGLSVRDDMRHVVALAVEKEREEATKDAKFRPDPRTLWVVWFEDAAVRPEVFFGDGAEEAARAFYKQKLASWSCHLLGRIPDAAIAAGKGEK